MATDASLDVTVVGRRLRRRVLLALGLFGVLPVLVLAYAVHRYFFADVRSLSGINLFGLQGLVFFTLLAMVGGAWILRDIGRAVSRMRSEEHTSELQSRLHLVCRLLLEKKKKK